MLNDAFSGCRRLGIVCGIAGAIGEGSQAAATIGLGDTEIVLRGAGLRRGQQQMRAVRYPV